MNSLELLACVLLVSLSACISASEIALFSLSRFQLRYLKENFRPTQRKIKRLLSDPGGLLITLLVINEVINVALTSLITEAIAKSHIPIPEKLSAVPRWTLETVLGTLITAPIVLFLCEITPKTIGVKINQLVATLFVTPLLIIYKILTPIRFLLTHLVRLFLPGKEKRRPTFSHISSSNESNNTILKESDFLMMVEEGHKEGAIQEREFELIKNVFELDDTTVAEVSTPLSKVLSLTVDTKVQGALIAVRSQRFSRIPVLSTNRKEVVGILYAKDLLQAKLEPQLASTPIATIMKKPFYVHPTMRLNSLFRKFKQNKIHMAIVKTPENMIHGVVTMSDILDALFEDFFLEVETNHLSLRRSKDSNLLNHSAKRKP